MISIIIPVYNTAPYLDKCFQSVIDQTYTDWECIVVDDGSTDNGGEICDNWGKKDSRFVIIHQENTGVSVARNHGIEISRGNHICFIDSDDWVSKYYLSDLIVPVKADLVVSGLIRKLQNSKNRVYMPQQTGLLGLNAESLPIFVDLNKSFLLYGPVAKLYNSTIIKRYNIRFPLDCSLGEDLEFNYHYLHYTSSLFTVSKANYFYRITSSGSLSSLLRKDQFDTDYRQWKKQKLFYIEKDIWHKPARDLLYRRLWEIVHDGLFRGLKIKSAGLSYIKNILSIDEIDSLKEYYSLYDCSNWIKWSIIHRISYFFYGYYLLHR